VARIAFVSPPFGGHLHPILGLARRLAREHDVVVFSSAGARERIARAGVAAAVSETASDDAIDAIVRGARAAKNDPRALARQLRGNVALMRRFREEFSAFCSDARPDLVIADFAAPVAGFVAREHGIPWWTSHPSPCAIETRDGPPAYCGGWMPLPNPFGTLRDTLGRGAVATVKRALYALFAGSLRSFGMPGIYRADGTEHIYSPDRILALGYRELEFATRWPQSVHFVGPVAFAVERDGYVPPPLGPHRNVLVTIGTQAPWFTQTMAGAVANAARAHPEITFTFATGELDTPGHIADTTTTGATTAVANASDAITRVTAAIGNGENARTAGANAVPSNVVRVPYVHYETDVARYDLVVHHGGTGIANATLAAGVPALVHPLDYDQFDIAARLTAGGYARRLRNLDRLGSDVRDALANEHLRAATAAFARNISPRYDAPETTAALVQCFTC
jgi:UDP:flavonoid glycosyltransferase YjiC (YdhE family)